MSKPTKSFFNFWENRQVDRVLQDTFTQMAHVVGRTLTEGQMDAILNSSLSPEDREKLELEEQKYLFAEIGFKFFATSAAKPLDANTFVAVLADKLDARIELLKQSHAIDEISIDKIFPKMELIVSTRKAVSLAKQEIEQGKKLANSAIFMSECKKRLKIVGVTLLLFTGVLMFAPGLLGTAAAVAPAAMGLQGFATGIAAIQAAMVGTVSAAGTQAAGVILSGIACRWLIGLLGTHRHTLDTEWARRRRDIRPANQSIRESNIALKAIEKLESHLSNLLQNLTPVQQEALKAAEKQMSEREEAEEAQVRAHLATKPTKKK